jgi:site-specific recombinase XerC
MAKTLPQVADSTDLSAIGPLRESFLRHLAAENKSTSTRLTYGKAVEQFGDFTARSGMPQDVSTLRREHIEAFLIDLQANGWKPASVANRSTGPRARPTWPRPGSWPFAEEARRITRPGPR